jgi:hypothetical protein
MKAGRSPNASKRSKPELLFSSSLRLEKTQDISYSSMFYFFSFLISSDSETVYSLLDGSISSPPYSK